MRINFYFKFFIFILFSFLLFEQNALAVGLNIKSYYHATCPDYTGTWQGFATDPNDLYDNGGPWPIKVSFLNQGDKMVGLLNGNLAPNNVAKVLSDGLLTTCNGGFLTNIHLGSKNICVMNAQSGSLVSKNVMILKIPVQGGMMGTEFIAILTRTDNTYPRSLPMIANTRLAQLAKCQ